MPGQEIFTIGGTIEMRMDESIKPKKKSPLPLNRGGLLSLGVFLIVVAVIMLGLSFWESFWGKGRVRVVEVPGFHELSLETAGLYAGVYQHRRSGPLPVKTLSKLDVRIMSKGDYEEVPVLMNTSGQIFERFGLKGMPVFNFVVERPGVYTMSAVYPGQIDGPAVPVFIVPQTAQNIKQTLVVGTLSFLLFLGSGIFILVRLNRWAPK